MLLWAQSGPLPVWWLSIRLLGARRLHAGYTAQSKGTCCHQGSLTALLLLHPPFPLKQDKEHTFLRQSCSQGTIVIHHFPPEKCKYVLADSGVIYYPRLRYGFEQERLAAGQAYLRDPLGGFAGWAELGLEVMPGANAGALAAENGPGSLPSRLYIVGVQQRWLPPWK